MCELLPISVARIDDPQVVSRNNGQAISVGCDGQFRFNALNIRQPVESRHVQDAATGARGIEQIPDDAEQSCCDKEGNDR